MDRVVVVGKRADGDTAEVVTAAKERLAVS